MSIKSEHGYTAAVIPGCEVENDVDEIGESAEDHDYTSVDPNLFATVISRFDPLHKKKKYDVTTQEIVRRLHSPEHMTVTKIEEYVRDSKKPNSGVKRRLSLLAADLPKNNKRRMRTSAFTKWTEAESKEVVNSLEDDCTAYYPKDHVVQIIDKSLDTLSDAAKKSSIEKTKEILSALSNSINSVENFNNPLWSQYAMITHEFGPWAMKYFLTMLIDSCDSLL